MDLSLTNPNVASFLAGKSQEPPVGEFMYVHTHRIRNNFVEQIEKMVLQTSLIVSQDRKYKAVVEKLFTLTIQLGKQLDEIDEKNAPAILHTLRQIYTVCKNVIG